MHKNKWSKRFRRLVSIGAVATMLVPTIGQAETIINKENNKEVKKEIRNNYDSILDKSNISASKLDENIDVASQEKVSIIVEFNSPALAQSQFLNKTQKSLKSNTENEHEEFKIFLNKLNKEKSVSEFKINHEYENVYNGVSMTIKGSEVKQLLESKVVKKIWNNDKVQLEIPKEVETKKEVNPKMSDSVPHIGVDKLHNEGLKGKGIKVGVLDTGVDYNHPDLKDNYKGGYDFVNNDDDPMETTYKDWQGSGSPEFSTSGSYYTSHGTHVAGTILGNAKSNIEASVLGVAPEADLHAYKVLGPYGGGATDGILAGIEQSVTDGMEVINLSLGADVNSPDSPLAVACNNATLAGVVTVIANGNAGPGTSTVGTPGAAALPISVGASSTSIQLETFKLTSSKGSNLDGTILAKDYKTSLNDFVSKEYSVVDCGLGAKKDYENIDVKGKLALVKRGDFALNDKVSYAKEAGAVGVLLYNNIDGKIDYYAGESAQYVPTIDLDKASGEKLAAELKDNSDYKIKLDLSGKIGTEGDKLADFSSRGPVINGNIKPDVVAPGVNIRSTYPEYINHKEDGEDYDIAYSRISGTSMAAPHVSGVAALMVQDHKNKNEKYIPEDIKLSLMNTAKDLNGEYGVNEMGAGRIDAYKAVNPGISITNNAVDESVDLDGNKVTLNHKVGSMSFGTLQVNDKTTKVSDELIIKNNTDKTKTFEVSVEYVAASESHGGLDAVKNGVKLEVKNNAVANKNKETKLDVNLVIPSGAEQGLYQGYINLVSRKDKNEKYQIPFSVKYLEGGISHASIDRNAMTTNSDNYHPWLIPGIPGSIAVNSPIEKLDFVIKDFETKKDIGYTISYPGEWFAPGIQYRVDNIISMSPSVFPINEDGTIDNIQIPLKDGKYIFEYRATDKDGKATGREFPLLIDTESATIQTDKKPGIYEITEKDFTQDIDPATGETYNAYWVKGNVDDNSIGLLNEMGVKATKKHNQVSPIINGMPQVAFRFNIDEDGNFKVGITNDDINPLSLIDLVPVDIATNGYPAPPSFKFIKEGTPYMNLSIDKEVLTEKDEFNLSVSMNNIDKISTIKTNIIGTEGINTQSVELSKEIKGMLNEKGYKADINHKVNDYNGISTLEVEVKITDDKGNLQNIAVDGNLLDVKYKIDDENNIINSDIYFTAELYNSEFKDKDGNKVKGIDKDIFDRVKYNRKESMADIINIVESTAFGFDLDAKKLLEKYIWVEDSEGKKHEVKLNEWTESYIASNLPPSDKMYKIVYDVPGHFRKEGKFIPSLVENGEIHGKLSIIGSGIFNGVALAGDTNKDGAIDIVDAKNIADVYNETSTSKIEGKDLNFDGKVDAKDMKYIVENFLEVNEQDKNAKTPQKTIDGKTLDDILNEIGYKK